MTLRLAQTSSRLPHGSSAVMFLCGDVPLRRCSSAFVLAPMAVPHAALKRVEERRGKAVREAASPGEHREANFFLPGSSPLPAGVRRNRASLAERGAGIKGCCAPPAPPTTAVLTATLPGAGEDVQDHRYALSKPTQSTVSLLA